MEENERNGGKGTELRKRERMEEIEEKGKNGRKWKRE